jgi:hypothetical protein
MTPFIALDAIREARARGAGVALAAAGFVLHGRPER